jgi:hypothetical protein
MPYSPEKSRMTSEQEIEWQMKPLNGTLEQVPSIGKVSIQTLKQYVDHDFPDGINTVWQLFGKFLMLRTFGMSQPVHLQSFYDFLADVGSPPSHLNTVVQAIAAKMEIGFRVPCTSSEELKTSSRMSESSMIEMWSKSSSCEFGVRPADVLKGAGIGPKTERILHDEGIETLWQMIGKLLSTCNDEQRNSPDSFLLWLGEIGVTSGWKNTITVAVTELISMGIFLPGSAPSNLVNTKRARFERQTRTPLKNKSLLHMNENQSPFPSPPPMPSLPEHKECHFTQKQKSIDLKLQTRFAVRVQEFYAKYCPSKLADKAFVNRTVEKYSYPGGEALLFKTLVSKYGPEPHKAAIFVSVEFLTLALVLLLALWCSVNGMSGRTASALSAVP